MLPKPGHYLMPGLTWGKVLWAWVSTLELTFAEPEHEAAGVLALRSLLSSSGLVGGRGGGCRGPEPHSL